MERNFKLLEELKAELGNRGIPFKTKQVLEDSAVSLKVRKTNWKNLYVAYSRPGRTRFGVTFASYEHNPALFDRILGELDEKRQSGAKYYYGLVSEDVYQDLLEHCIDVAEKWQSKR